MHMALYNGLLWIGMPVLRHHMNKRLAAGKEDPVRFEERFGNSTRPRPEGSLIWIHAASVGESISALALVDGLLKKGSDRHILVTTGTRTSAEIMAVRLPERAFHQFVPIDMKGAVRRFLEHWQPDLAIWMESEVWPNLIMESAARHIPMMMANARITEKSYNIWRQSFGLSKKLLSNFNFCSAQSETSAVRLRELGANSVECLGNLKFAAEPLPFDPAALETLSDNIAGRPLWLAASTHRGEEDIILSAHRQLRETYSNLLTLIVPRHPERGAEIAALTNEARLHAVQRSQNKPITEETDVYIADTIGELGLFYRLSKIVLIGGSLVPNGGQNPLEAARLNCALLHGPHMDNFTEIMETFDAASASSEAKNTEALAQVVGRYLGDSTLLDEMTARAAGVVATGQETLEKTLFRIEELLREGKNENP